MKVFLVDDEPLILHYIEQCILDASSNHEIVGTAGSGIKALEQIALTRPDVVFTDITMPKMNGLELLRKIKSSFPNINVVMLTCHDDFEFARQAIWDRADDYILKSEIDPPFLRQKLEQLAQSIKKIDSVQFANRNKQAFLLRAPSGADVSAVRIVSEKDLKNPELLMEQESFVAFGFLNTSENVDAILKHLPEFFSNELMYPYDEIINIMLCNIRNLPGCDTLEEKERSVNAYMEKVRPHLSGSISRSQLHYRLAQIPRAIEDAVNDIEWMFFGSPLEHLPDFAAAEQQLRDLMLRAVVRIDSKNILGACDCVEQMLDCADRTHPHLKVLFGLLHHIMEMICHYERNGVKEADFPLSGRFSDLRTQTLLRLEAVRSGKGRYSKSITQAVEYIRQHFSEDLNLGLVAEKVFLNREYLSRQFKKEMGMNFSDYLLELRLEEALFLLRTTSLPTGEIATRTGFANVSYFSSVFKKVYGFTPREARTSL